LVRVDTRQCIALAGAIFFFRGHQPAVVMAVARQAIEKNDIFTQPG